MIEQAVERGILRAARKLAAAAMVGVVFKVVVGAVDWWLGVRAINRSMRLTADPREAARIMAGNGHASKDDG